MRINSHTSAAGRASIIQV